MSLWPQIIAECGRRRWYIYWFGAFGEIAFCIRSTSMNELCASTIKCVYFGAKYRLNRIFNAK